MKKTLLFLSIVAFTFALSAQNRVNNQPGVVRSASKMNLTGNETGAAPANVASPLRTLNHNFMGSTYYDVQTNGSMSNRVNAHSDGSISAIWTAMTLNINSRGTGYNYYENGQWASELPSARIEDVRTGWGTTTSVGDFDIVASHNGSDALVISVSQKGSGEWTYSQLKGPQLVNGSQTSTSLLWPSIASSGNTIHLLACTESNDGFKFNGIQTCLVYYRGTFEPSTKSITWSAPRIVGDFTSDEVTRFSGDDYSIAAKGNVVAVVVQPSFRGDSYLWKSTDNGVNFTRTVFCEAAAPGDTAYFDEGSYSVAIGDDGLVHIAGGTWMSITRATSDTITYWPGMGYLYYWNESMEPIKYDGDQSFKDPEVMRENGYTVVERVDLDGDGMITTVGYGIDGYPSYGVGPISMPQIVAQDGKVYIVFANLLESLFVDAQSAKFYRGIFGIKSTDNGQNFGDISWLSYNKDVYYINSFELFPLDTTVTVGQLMNCLESWSENVYPSVAPNIVNGNIAMVWLNDAVAGSDIKEAPSTQPVSSSDHENYIYALIMNADSIGIYNNTNEVWQGLWIDHTGISNNVISGMKLYPNPATNNVNVMFYSEDTENAVVSVMNLMGQTVYSTVEGVSEGYNKIQLNVNNLPAGVYMVNIRTNRGTSTQKLIVK